MNQQTIKTSVAALLWSMVACWMLVGCGQKGPLSLPNATPAAGAASAAAK